MSKVTLVELVERLVEKHEGNKSAAARAIGAESYWARNVINRQMGTVKLRVYLVELANELGLQWHDVEHLEFGYQPPTDEEEAAAREEQAKKEAQAQREAIAAAMAFWGAPQGTTHRLRGEPVRIVRLVGKKRYFRWANGEWVQSTWVERNRRFVEAL